MDLKMTRNTLTIWDSKANDLCQKNKLVGLISLAALTVLPSCPINSALTFCHKNKNILTFSQTMKKILSTLTGVASEFNIRIEINHDTGKSCFEVKAEILKV